MALTRLPLWEREGYIGGRRHVRCPVFSDILSDMSLWPLQTFDPTAEYAVVERKLPLWSQAGAMCFLTWRAIDSIPANVLSRWHAERDEWLRSHAIDSSSPFWRRDFEQLPQPVRAEFSRKFSTAWHDHLDTGHGACVLRRPEIAKIVRDSLLYGDGKLYDLDAFVVMPNHVHILAAFVDEQGMLDQCKSWKYFTSVKINRILGQTCRFWQQDGFDHLVRSMEHLEAFRRYIRANPDKAMLRVGEYLAYVRSHEST
ncbi:MAG: transposase [Gemmataceae bacterium]